MWNLLEVGGSFRAESRSPAKWEALLQCYFMLNYNNVVFVYYKGVVKLKIESDFFCAKDTELITIHTFSTKLTLHGGV